MRNKKVEFQRVPESNKNVRALGSLVFDDKKINGPSAFLDLRNWPSHKLLARDCIAALYSYATPEIIGSGFSYGSYKTAIKAFLRYCQKIRVPEDFRFKEIDQEFLIGYRAYIFTVCADLKNDGRRRRFGNITRLILAGQTIGLSNDDFSPPRNFAYVDDGDTTEPYSAIEAITLEEACRGHIREIIARLDSGKAMLAIGIDPRGRNLRGISKSGERTEITDSQRKWNQLPNLIWYLVHAMDGKYLPRKQLILQKHSSFNNSIMGTFGGQYRKDDVYSHLYPLYEDLIPFLILLCKKTGRNESSIFLLKRTCLQEFDGKWLLWYIKKRGSEVLYKKYIENNGPFSPVSLIKTVLSITEPLVKFAQPEDREFLFLGMVFDQKKSESGVNPADPCYMKYLMNRNGGWAERFQVFDDSGIKITVSTRRLRTTYLTNRYKKHGQLARVSRDAAHSLTETSVPYVRNFGTKHVHTIAIRSGIEAARDISRPTIIEHTDVSIAAKSLGVEHAIAAGLLKGEQDVFFAACKDYFNQPGGKKNTPCQNPWGCLFCSNSVITRHVLPRVIAFKIFMQEQRSLLSAEDWSQKFSTPWSIIHSDVLPKFSTDAIAEAERLAVDGILYVPISYKV